jgi:hydrophobic/amphiphilic exporter-1 (mainly G- bacteria), HAE1 family
VQGIVDIENSLKPTNPTLDIVVNRELASDLGVAMGQIAITTRALVAGEQVGQWQAPDGENHQILVRLPQDERRNIGDLDRIYVASYSFNADATPRMVPLRQIAEFKPGLGERNIERRNLQRQVQLSAGVNKDRSAGEVSGELRKVVDAMVLPPGYRVQWGGSSEDMRESLNHAIAALALAVIFIYIVLASQFGSFLQPLAIMASLPMSLIGVFLALLAWRSTLNIFSVIGFIMLMGLVTKNAILLVDFTNQAIKAGKSRTDAILEAGQVRLRPILMTTAAMVFGMLPLALAFGPGSEQQSPMAHAVIGGIITSTVLTLVVVPVLYTYMDSLGRWASGKLSHSHADDESPKTASEAGAPNAAD